MSEQFIGLTLDLNLSQVINQPTRGQNILDLILTTAPESLHTISHLEGFSDHQLLQASIKLPVQFYGVETKQIRDYNKADFTKINDELDTFFNQILLPCFYSRTVQDNWLKFKNVISTLINQFVPLITISNDKTNPWFTRALNTMRNKKKRLYKRAKQIRTPSAWQKYKDCLNAYCRDVDSA